MRFDQGRTVRWRWGKRTAPAIPAEGVIAAMRIRDEVGIEREVLAKSIAVEVRVEKAVAEEKVRS